MINVNHKQLKASLAPEVRKLGLAFLVLKLDEFLIFDNFFLDLADFWDLNNFKPFNNFLVFDNFPYFSIDLSPLLIPPTSLAASTSSATSTYEDKVLFSIDESGMTILLKL